MSNACNEEIKKAKQEHLKAIEDHKQLFQKLFSTKPIPVVFRKPPTQAELAKLNEAAPKLRRLGRNLKN